MFSFSSRSAIGTRPQGAANAIVTSQSQQRRPLLARRARADANCSEKDQRFRQLDYSLRDRSND
jgi:hypothetical protein